MSSDALKKLAALEASVKSPSKPPSVADLEKDLLCVREVIHYQNELKVLNNDLTSGIAKAEKEMADRTSTYKSEKLLSTFSGMLKQLEAQHDTLLENKKKKAEESILAQYEKTQSYHDMINDAQQRLTHIGERNAELGQEKEKWMKELIYYNDLSSANVSKIEAGKEEYKVISERISELFANKEKKKKKEEGEKEKSVKQVKQGEGAGAGEGEENKDHNVVEVKQEGDLGQKAANAEATETEQAEEDDWNESSDLKLIMHPHDLERMNVDEEDFAMRAQLYTERQKELSRVVTEQGEKVTVAHDLFKNTNLACKAKADIMTGLLQSGSDMEKENTRLHSKLMNIQKQLETSDPEVMNAAMVDAEEEVAKLNKLLNAFQAKLKA